MGLFKKIFKPVRKVLDKVIPNEIKPALPYLAAFTPFMAPTSGVFGTMAGRALLSGGANIAAQLAQEGTTEDDLNLLSTGIAAATGALSAPGAGSTIRGVDPKFIGPRPAPEGILGQGREFLAKSADFLSSAKGSGGIGDILRPGGTKMGFDAATATALGIPTAQGTGDAMYTEAVRLSKQEIIDDALSGLGEGASDADRALAIRTAMLQYGFGDDEIEETITAAGYKAGGRVGFKFGGIDAAIDKVEDESIKESMKFASDIDEMDIPMMDLVEEFEIIFKRKPSSLDELKQFYRDFYEYKGPGENIKMKEKIKEKVVMEAKDGGRIGLREGGVLSQILPQPGFGMPLPTLGAFQPLRRAEAVFPRLNQLEQGVDRAEETLGRIRSRLGAEQRGGTQLPMLQPATQLPKGRPTLGIQTPPNMLSFLQQRNDLAQGMKDGGMMDLGGKEMDLRGGGFVPIGKKERADDVPARLSKNEFVMTADAVRAAGGGSVNKGAKRMYELMNNLEARV